MASHLQEKPLKALHHLMAPSSETVLKSQKNQHLMPVETTGVCLARRPDSFALEAIHTHTHR